MPDKGAVRVEDFKGLRVAYLREQALCQDAAPHVMRQMRTVALQHKLNGPDSLFLTIINDHPHSDEKGRPGACDLETCDHRPVRVDAAVIVSADFEPPAESGLAVRKLPPGLHAVYHHVGPYKTLRDAWAHFASLSLSLPGYKLRRPSGPDGGPSFQIFRNDPAHTPEDQLITDLYQPVEAIG